MPKDGAGEFGEEPLDEVEPGAVFGGEDKCEASLGLLSVTGAKVGANFFWRVAVGR